jgi:hypothetical protein
MIMYSYVTDGGISISNFQQQPGFSSFLPGIAGLQGIPLWAFYVNRGQGIVSFGREGKDGSMMEFQPAVKAYHDVYRQGFRTFLRFSACDGSLDNSHSPLGLPKIYEPFQPWLDDQDSPTDKPIQTLTIWPDRILLQEELKYFSVQVEYSTLYNQPVPALIRTLRFINTSADSISIELLDGMARFIPAGSGDQVLKNMSHTLMAWMQVEDIHGVGAYAGMSSSVSDHAEVSQGREGNFSFSFVEHHGNQSAEQSFNKSQGQSTSVQFLQPLVDPYVVFGNDTSFGFPVRFKNQGLKSLYDQPQIKAGRYPTLFVGTSSQVDPGATLLIHTIVGAARTKDQVIHLLPTCSQPGFIEKNKQENRDYLESLVFAGKVSTGSPQFDGYVKQTYLDNLLRGGYPHLVTTTHGEEPFYLYSRKHGDLERDYNAFHLLPEYYSRGFANYRDVNQNRRSDIFFEPRVYDANIREFLNLIQADGYNPLVVQGLEFYVPQGQSFQALLSAYPNLLGDCPESTGNSATQTQVGKKSPTLVQLLTQGFTLGSLYNQLEAQGVDSPSQVLEHILSFALSRPTAEFHEGYWIDHWTYILDLIDSFCAIYPDRFLDLGFKQRNYSFFPSHAVVLPRSKRYVEHDNQVRQYYSVRELTEEEVQLIQNQATKPDRITSSLFEKLLVLLGIKYTTLDAQGIGVEMEAGKPGWYDALNGLPGLFGSSSSETFELLRLAGLLNQLVELFALSGSDSAIVLPAEAGFLWTQIAQVHTTYVQEEHERFWYWDKLNTLREQYRESIRLGLSGETMEVSLDQVRDWLAFTEKDLNGAVTRCALFSDQGLAPTYFIGTVTNWARQVDGKGKEVTDEKGRPRVEISAITYKPLPLFLEGVVKQLKLFPSSGTRILKQVKVSELYDSKLGMYKVNTSLAKESFEIGRAKAFRPGWLENESVWLHMEYKFLLELLKAGMSKEFWQEAKTALVPFMDPEVYGRSIFESSSFIASSAHDDPQYHGRGFVARLSGSTAELLQMLQIALWGIEPFRIMPVDGGTDSSKSLEVKLKDKLQAPQGDSLASAHQHSTGISNQVNNQVALSIRPQLPGFLFKDDGTLEARFLGFTQVIFVNPQRKDLFYPIQPQGYEVVNQFGTRLRILGPDITGELVHSLRNREIPTMMIFFGGFDDSK